MSRAARWQLHPAARFRRGVHVPDAGQQCTVTRRAFEQSFSCTAGAQTRQRPRRARMFSCMPANRSNITEAQ
jgi:hypothetical protein